MRCFGWLVLGLRCGCDDGSEDELVVDAVVYATVEVLDMAERDLARHRGTQFVLPETSWAYRWDAIGTYGRSGWVVSEGPVSASVVGTYSSDGSWDVALALTAYEVLVDGECDAPSDFVRLDLYADLYLDPDGNGWLEGRVDTQGDGNRSGNIAMTLEDYAHPGLLGGGGADVRGIRLDGRRVGPRTVGRSSMFDCLDLF